MPRVPKKILITTIPSAAAIVVGFIISQSPFSAFSLQITGLTVSLYIVVSFLIRKKIVSINVKVMSDIIIFSFAVSLILFSTGGFNSPIFFLTYFLLFGLSLLSSPITSVVAAIIFTVLFVLSPRTDLWMEILQIISLIAIAPISAVFGRQYLEIVKDEQKISALKNVSQDFAEEIKFQEENVKKWTEGEFKSRIVNIQRYLGNLIKDRSLDETKKGKIQDIYYQIYQLFLSGEELNDKINK